MSGRNRQLQHLPADTATLVDAVTNGQQQPAVPKDTPAEVLDAAHVTVRRWLGADYDMDAFYVVAAAAAAERLDGDPPWLLLISGSGNAKTETVMSLVGAGAVLASRIKGEASLLSGTPRKEKAADSTGGLLRRVGQRGVLVIKDVTSILSMNRDARGEVLAALREVHDGRWDRDIGAEGGRQLTWEGRIVVIGAVTTAWDKAHAVIAEMGPRFVCLRMDSTTGRVEAGRQAISNVGSEDVMRDELATAMAAVVAQADPSRAVTLDGAETERLLAAADVATSVRTAVERDYRGDVVDAHMPEMPTRFAKELAQVMRGAVAIGIDRDKALRLALRCARDSMPPLRLAVLEDVAAHPLASTHDVRQRLDKPRATVDRELQALHMLRVLTCDEEPIGMGERTRWRYSVAETIDPSAVTLR